MVWGSTRDILMLMEVKGSLQMSPARGARAARDGVSQA